MTGIHEETFSERKKGRERRGQIERDREKEWGRRERERERERRAQRERNHEKKRGRREIEIERLRKKGKGENGRSPLELMS